MVDEIARELGLMEQRVMADVKEDPQRFLSELFAARHELLTIKTMAEQDSEIYRRAIRLTTFAPPEGLERMKDVLDQYETVARISAAQMRFQQGVTEFYRARTDTKMTIAAERLAVIAAITLPITSLSSVIGMNVIVNDSTRWIPLIILCLNHAGYFVGLAALDPQAGLVVSIRFIGIGGCERDDHAGTVSCDSKLIKPSAQIDRIPQRGTAGVKAYMPMPCQDHERVVALTAIFFADHESLQIIQLGFTALRDQASWVVRGVGLRP